MALQTFSPREIQARVRGGDSAEVVAAETGWPLDKVLRYAEPLLAERAFIAEQAQAVEVRRSGGGATLLQAAAAALGVPTDDAGIEWDAYRRGDGKWIVTAEYREADGAHGAEWTYDHAGRNLHPLDDDARTLMGARPMAVVDDELDIADALDLVAEPEVVRDAEARPRLVAVPDDDDDEATATDAEQASSEDQSPAAARANHSEQTISIPHPSGKDAAPAPAAKKTAAKKTTAKAPAAKKATPARKPRARKGRASVPSWDEILFGATKPDSED